MSNAADWYYIGHYGQLGPLTLDQMKELVDGAVVTPETYVWKQGLPDWVFASQVSEFARMFAASPVEAVPPPPPSPGARISPPGQSTPPTSAYAEPRAATCYPSGPAASYHPSAYSNPDFTSATSNRSRILAGVLQLIIPGVGRIYMGYSAIGILQLILSPCGVGYIWSFIDGILILVGNVKLDGYGRRMAD